MEINETKWRWKKCGNLTQLESEKERRRNCANICRWERRTNIEKVSKYSFNFSSNSSLAFLPMGELWSIFRSGFKSKAENVPDQRQLRSGFMLCSALSCSDFDNSRVFSSPPTQQQNFFDCKNSHLAFSPLFIRPETVQSELQQRQKCAKLRHLPTDFNCSEREWKVMVNLTHELKFTKWKMWALSTTSEKKKSF